MKAGVPQSSVLGPLLFLIYISNVSESLVCELKLFSNGTSLFCLVKAWNISAINLNNDLDKIRNWAFKWKISFDLNSFKKIQKINFSCKLHICAHPPLLFSNSTMNRIVTQSHMAVSWFKTRFLRTFEKSRKQSSVALFFWGFFFLTIFFFLLRIFITIQKKTFKSNNKNNNYINQLLRLLLLKHTHKNNNKKKAIPTSLPRE